MHWNEKVDLVKKKFSSDDFFVPHSDRKEILRKIETKFISRDEDYYDLNNYNERFANWWDGVDAKEEVLTIDERCSLEEIEKLVEPNKLYWLAAEFEDGVMLYKTSKEAAFYLISLGLTWSNIYHFIHLKYENLVSVKILEDKVIGEDKRIKALAFN